MYLERWIKVSKKRAVMYPLNDRCFRLSRLPLVSTPASVQAIDASYITLSLFVRRNVRVSSFTLLFRS